LFPAEGSGICIDNVQIGVCCWGDGMLSRRLFSLVLLSVFFALSASIGLCHTDDAGARDPYCPACNFQSSCVAIDIVEVFLLPDFAPFEFLKSEECLDYSALIIVRFPARPPPFV
jgi:hypothetical protein